MKFRHHVLTVLSGLLSCCQVALAALPSVAVSPSGTLAATQLSVTINCNQVDTGATKSVWVAALLPGQSTPYFLGPSGGWAGVTNGTPPLPLLTTNQDVATFDALGGVRDLTSLSGTEVYVGFARSWDELLRTGAYTRAYVVPSAAGASTLYFAGYFWQVRTGSGGPGPNNWSANNAWVDSSGQLHLRISHDNNVWNAAEIYTKQRLGFGTYQFQIAGKPGTLDDNVVLGLFNYTEPDVGPDGTNEIDVEFATWGGQQPQHGNWTVWPAVPGITSTSSQFDVAGGAAATTYRFTWQSGQVAYQALSGTPDLGDDTGQYATWVFAPNNPLNTVPQHALPLHMNLWLYQGLPPSNGQPVEMVISAFRFKPL